MNKLLKMIGYSNQLDYYDRILYLMNLCVILVTGIYLTLYLLYITFIPAIGVHIVYFLFSTYLFLLLKRRKFDFVRYALSIVFMVQLTLAVFLWFPVDTGFNLFYFMVPMSIFILMRSDIKAQRIFSVTASILASLLYLISETVRLDFYMYETGDQLNLLFRGIAIVSILIPMTYIFAKLAKDNYKSQQELLRLASTDVLTQTYNRRVLYSAGVEAFLEAKTNAHDYSIILFDIDYFKRVNDTYGHPAGDVLLKQLARLISQNIRKTDLFSRYGGEEFAILLRKTSREESEIIAEKILNIVRDHTFMLDNNAVKITISVGMIQYSKNFSNFDEMMKLVDNALYDAKENGRDRISAASEEADEQVSTDKI